MQKDEMGTIDYHSSPFFILLIYCNSIHVRLHFLLKYMRYDMKKINSKVHPDSLQADKKEKTKTPGYPLYPNNEDIFNKFKEEGSIDPEDTSKKKISNKKKNTGKNNEKDFEEDKSGSDLDVPGSELDDENEKTGSEDEENNLYSLGGDDHD